MNKSLSTNHQNTDINKTVKFGASAVDIEKGEGENGL